MSKTAKLYQRLDELEQEYTGLLMKEFEQETKFGSSYLSRKIPHLFDGRRWRNESVGHLEMLEKDIIALRHQLGEPLSPSPVSLAFEFIERRAKRKDRFDGGETALAREMLERITQQSGGLQSARKR